ncbi:kinase-like domain-containing protein [Sporodiniella umbellata]|nr:kinase-like domain-containing protein [Sporodiniella umbellata]
MQQVNGIPIYTGDPSPLYKGLDGPPTWFSAQGGVYKCREVETNKKVAVKKYLVEENQHEDMFVMPKELVENEIYSMTKCVHPNILELFAVYLHEEFVYLIMPLCTGGSLQQYVFEHQMSVGQIVYIIQSIASGLEKLHGYGYIHRDMKCDNIFLHQEKNSIVIGDFGVVSVSPTADSSIEEAGVVLFWSPELVQQKVVDYKIDIWALGIVILEVLSGGKAPYEDEGLEEEEIKQRILSVKRPAYPPNLPADLIDLLNHCLEPDPKTRYSSSDILRHPFITSNEPQLLFPAAPLSQNKKSKQSPLPAKCRIPVPSFSVDRSVSASIPVQEKILNVYLKRQSLSATNRSQGSRLPMLCVKQPIIQEDKKIVVKSPKEKKVAVAAAKTIPKRAPATTPSSCLIPPSSPNKTRVKSPLVETNIRKPKLNTTQSTTSSIPIKASIYRNKKPPGESRTARLMMGMSTARRQSYKARDITNTNDNSSSHLPTLAHKQRSPEPKETTQKQVINTLKGKTLRVH